MTENFEDINKSRPKGIFILSFVLFGLVMFLTFFNPAKMLSGEGAMLTIEDDKGNIWELSLIYSPRNDKVSGEPLIAKADVYVNGRTLHLDAVVEGQAGEQYMPAAYRNGSIQNPPSFKVHDEQDNVIGNGDFTFG